MVVALGLVGGAGRPPSAHSRPTYLQAVAGTGAGECLLGRGMAGGWRGLRGPGLAGEK